jgi:hypothetical protein
MQTASGVKHQVQPAGGVEYQDNFLEEQNTRYDLLEE